MPQEKKSRQSWKTFAKAVAIEVITAAVVVAILIHNCYTELPG